MMTNDITAKSVNKGDEKKYGQNYNGLLAANLRLNGLKALIYAFGLADCRYVEYGATLDFLTDVKRDDLVLDIGCGHSLLPSIMKKKASIVCLDLNSEALIWQRGKNSRDEVGLETVRSRGDILPYKNNTFAAVISISAIEHFTGNGDILAMKEIARVLRPGGVCIITVPLSEHNREVTDWMDGIPGLYRRILGKRLLIKALNLFNIDRDTSYFARHYSFEIACQRLVESSGLERDSLETFGGGPVRALFRFIHRELIPQSTFMPLEYISAKTIKVVNSDEFLGGLIIKLRKTLI